VGRPEDQRGRSEQAHAKKWADRELRRAKRNEQYFLSRFGPELEQWTRDRLARTKAKRKCVPLPGGTLGLRAVRPKLVVIDEGRLLAWRRRHLPKAAHQMGIAKGGTMDGTKYALRSAGCCGRAGSGRMPNYSGLTEQPVTSALRLVPHTGTARRRRGRRIPSRRRRP
jgi:hypothetical protein